MRLRSRLPDHWPIYVLFGILLLSTLLALVTAITYAYNQFSVMISVVGISLLLVTISIAWRITRSTRHAASATLLDQMTRFGLVLGLLWVVEITINNVVAPGLPARDNIDDVFWALVAIGLLVGSLAIAYQSGHASRGIALGTWSGFVSGVVACGMALSIAVFGMALLLNDPLNIAEWSSRTPDVIAPTMAAYFAYETFAGAFLHLTVLGIGMGAILGMIGGVIGALGKRGWRARRQTPE